MNSRDPALTSSTNQHYLPLPRPEPAVKSPGTFSSHVFQPSPQLGAKSAGLQMPNSSNTFLLATPTAANMPGLDPTVEQLFPLGVVADLEKEISKNNHDGIIGNAV